MVNVKQDIAKESVSQMAKEHKLDTVSRAYICGHATLMPTARVRIANGTRAEQNPIIIDVGREDNATHTFARMEDAKEDPRDTLATLARNAKAAIVATENARLTDGDNTKIYT